MTTPIHAQDDNTQLNRALVALKKMRARLDEVERMRTEPIAIVGLGCRFPGGAHDADSFWRLLHDGVDAIRDVPADRWDVDAYYDPDPEAYGKMYTRSGGFLEQVDQFDAPFFGISPREAQSLDPQQRLLLEVSWEALENAGQSPDALAGTRTGVFMGVTGRDYAEILKEGGPDQLNAYLFTGNDPNFAVGRIAYFLGLHGPAMAIDTACSSSLVAVHLACQSLRNGECQLALAGGVNIILLPEGHVTTSKARMLSPDGRCKTFDAAADGFVRGEGCGVVVLKRLSAAVADGDHIWAVIRGSAVNHDGRSSGLTVPNGLAQEALLREALANAQVEPAQIGYIEAHGTGTSLGDPIEARALSAVYARGRPADRPLVIGSVKTNIGHLESASGIAGLLKAVLVVYQGVIPPHLHFQTLNPRISWGELSTVIPSRPMPWREAGGPRLAGVSSFGGSGTNVHMVLAEAPVQESAARATERPAHLITLSAKSDEPLRELAGRIAGHLSRQPAVALQDLSTTLNAGRAHLSHRAAFVAGSMAQVQQGLAEVAEGRQGADVELGQVKGSSRPKVVFLFTGQGSQYTGMGRELYETQPVFRATMDRCAELLRPYLDHPLLAVLYPESHGGNGFEPAGAAELIHATAYTQPALFALEYALAKLWQSWGIEPAAVLGHSVGEYVAACVAGVMSLEDGLKLIAERGRLMQALPAGGAMAAVFADEGRVAAALAPYVDQVSIAALNGPDNTVISGSAAAVDAIVEELRAEGIKTRRLSVSHAFHSPLMEPMLDGFARVAGQVQFQEPRLPLVANVTGRFFAPGETPDADYWRRHARVAVRFAASIEELARNGYELFLEIGPNPTLSGMGERCLPEDAGAVWLPSLRQGRGEWQMLLGSLASLYVRGAEINWDDLDRGFAARRVPLPTYPFRRQRHWFEGDRHGSLRLQGTSLHPLLGERLRVASQESVFESRFSLKSHPFLADYRVHGHAVVPATAYLEMALVAGRELLRTGAQVVDDLTINQALILPEEGFRTVQMVLGPVEEGRASFRILSLDEDEARGAGERWLLHAAGVVQAAPAGAAAPSAEPLSAIRARCQIEVPVETLYDHLRQCGVQLGPSFLAVEQVWQHAGEAIGRLRLPEKLVPGASAYGCHPVMVDAAMQLIGAASEDGAAEPYMPIGLAHFRLAGPVEGPIWGHVLVRRDSARPDSVTCDVTLYDEAGHVVAEIKELFLRRAKAEALERARPVVDERWLHEVEWRPQPRASLAASLLPPTQVTGRLRDYVDRLSRSREAELIETLVPKMEALTTDYMIQACRRMGWTFGVGQHFQLEALAEELGITRPQRRMFRHIVEILAEDGIVAATGDGWEVRRTPDAVDPEAQAENLLAQYPECQPELAMARPCGRHLAEVLQGRADALELLFPGGSLETAERFYQDSLAMRSHNQLVAEAVKVMVAALPAGQKLRILEIGGGTGGTTAHLLPHLPAGQVEYTFSDISPLFTTKAKQKFADYHHVRYQPLDIEQEPAEQGFGGQVYDLVLAANVLHATRDLRQTLRHVKSLLAPGGTLLLLEGTRPRRFADLVVGLTEGWWRFEDRDLRPAYALLSPQRWLELLHAEGFAEAAAIPDQENPTELMAANAVLLARGPGAQPKSWIIFADKAGAGDRLAELLRARGDRCRRVYAGDGYAAAAQDVWQINPARSEDYRRLLGDILGGDQAPCQGVIFLWPLDAPRVEEVAAVNLNDAQFKAYGGALYLLQALIAAGTAQQPGLWLVTQGAHSVGSEEFPPALLQAPLWGLGRVIAHEHPEFHCVRVDLDPAQGATQIQALCEEILAGYGEPQVALRGESRYVARLVHSAAKPVPSQRSAAPGGFREDGTYLITGGFGGIGLLVARWMVDQGARHLVLMGRRGAPESALETLHAMEDAGAHVVVARGDVSQAADVARVLAEIAQTMPPLRGVVHSAAVLEDGVLLRQSWDDYAKVLAPKANGGWNLHTQTQGKALDFFVVFSAAAALFGSTGLGTYTVANTFLDALAHYRRRLGLPATSINWGLWVKVGMAGAVGSAREAQWDVAGMNAFSPQQALAAFGDVLRRDLPQVGIFSVEWSKFGQVLRNNEHLFVGDLVSQSLPEQAAGQPPVQVDLRRRLEQTSPKRRYKVLQDHVREQTMKVLGLTLSQPFDIQQPLQELGLDSLMAVELRNRLGAGLDLKRTLPATLVFDYPTVEAMTGYLAEKVLQMPAEADESTPPAQVQAPSQAQGIDMGLAELEEISDEEAEALLLAQLKQLQDGR